MCSALVVEHSSMSGDEIDRWRDGNSRIGCYTPQLLSLIVDNRCAHARVLAHAHVFTVMFEHRRKYVGVIFENLIFNNVWHKEVE
uniref:Uncharacterized protein n=1 Tax=Physcomitrium patens TaxID=3218 RepID=A0A2K1ID85_PHYPA|nr:hypothetical protein PHYPA_029378 [Physcomitrium patens]